MAFSSNAEDTALRSKSDFTVHKFMNGRDTQTDYYRTLDMAKELVKSSAIYSPLVHGRDFTLDMNQFWISHKPIHHQARFGERVVIGYLQRSVRLRAEPRFHVPRNYGAAKSRT